MSGKKKCLKCGARLRPGSKFCPKCGTSCLGQPTEPTSDQSDHDGASISPAVMRLLETQMQLKAKEESEEREREERERELRRARREQEEQEEEAQAQREHERMLAQLRLEEELEKAKREKEEALRLAEAQRNRPTSDRRQDDADEMDDASDDEDGFSAQMDKMSEWLHGSTQENSGKSLLIAYVLWLFLGYFGAHRFYCGKILTGLLWLFTGGMFMFGWMIDIFLIPKMVKDAD